jgi:hypothetical protein
VFRTDRWNRYRDDTDGPAFYLLDYFFKNRFECNNNGLPFATFFPCCLKIEKEYLSSREKKIWSIEDKIRPSSDDIDHISLQQMSSSDTSEQYRQAFSLIVQTSQSPGPVAVLSLLCRSELEII